MPEFKSFPPGAFCWAEVGTVNAKKTKTFYGELFGWKYEDKPAGEFGVYTMCRQNGKDVAGLYELSSELQKMGVPPHWMSYISVASADAACEKIQKHGGTVRQGPFDVMDVGRMAICADPTGAVFSIWQAMAHKGASVMGENGTPCWFELATRGVEKAEKFYRDVFGWSIKQGADAGFVYREFTASGANYPQGGMMELMKEHGNAPPHWMIYFTVKDCDADAKRVKELGGKVVVPPMDIPTVGRFSVVDDPAGATFAIIKLSLEEHKHGTKSAQTAQPPAAMPSSKAPASTPQQPKKK